MNAVAATLSRWGRILATGWSFLFFMIWGFSLGIALYPVLRIRFGRTRRAREAFMGHMRWTWKLFVRMMESIRAFDRIEIKGLDRFAQDRACLLVANHVTLVDIVAFGTAVRNFNCVVRTGLWNHRWFGLVVRACDFVPNVGSEAFIDRCREGFAQNRPLIIFPQGERTPPHLPLSFARGAAQIAARTGVPIVPVLITCDPPALMKGQPWYAVPSRAPRLVLDFQEPLTIPEAIAAEPSMPLKVRALNAFLEEYFRSQLRA